MKLFKSLIIIVICFLSFGYKANAEEITSIYELEFSIDSLGGSKINFSKFKGKKILIVNVASKCGYTSQYADLQKLSEMYNDQLVIIGVPCNQFANQEPGSPAEIASFCKLNYGVKFLITEKVKVKGKNQHKLYYWLTHKDQNGKIDTSVRWNFQKFLIDEDGKLLKSFKSSINPLDSEITNLL